MLRQETVVSTLQSFRFLSLFFSFFLSFLYLKRVGIQVIGKKGRLAEQLLALGNYRLLLVSKGAFGKFKVSLYLVILRR